VQPLKHLEDALVKLRVDTDTVVADEKPQAVIMLLETNVNFWFFVRPEFDGVINQVQEHLDKLRAVCPDVGQLIAGYYGPGFLNAFLKLVDRFP
jgi:hypothetical protein